MPLDLTKRADLQKLVDQLLSNYLDKMKAILCNDLNKAVQEADLYSVKDSGSNKSRKANYDDVVKAHCFNAEGGFIKDLPISDATKLGRLRAVMHQSTMGPAISDQEKFILYCARFSAGSTVAAENMLAYKDEKPETRQAINKLLEDDIANLAARTISSNDQATKNSQNWQPRLDAAIAQKDFMVALLTNKILLQNHLNEKSPGTSKDYALQALIAINRYLENGNFDALKTTLADLQKNDQQRATGWMFNSGARSTTRQLITELNHVVSKEAALRVAPPSPTQLPTPSSRKP